MPLLSRGLLVDLAAVTRGLERVRRAGLVPEVPNSWQLTLGVLRMWHRMLFRSDTVGTSTHFPVRNTWRARLLAPRPLRFPFLLAERAVAPLDFTGLRSSRERVVRHLLAAHHDGAQFVYDLQLLSCTPGALEGLHREVLALLAKGGPRLAWLRDLAVYERYHEELLAAVEAALAGRDGLTEHERLDPDVTFTGYLRWCARQPHTQQATVALWRAGLYSIADGIAEGHQG